MINFFIKHVSNMTFIEGQTGRVYESFDTETLTERKLNNAIKRISKSYQNARFVDAR